ncbi:MAG: hypothetical protein L7U87_01825 [Chlamydiales bacterium]|nr:hypothetical protein [Chlamydiales bacterium]
MLKKIWPNNGKGGGGAASSSPLTGSDSTGEISWSGDGREDVWPSSSRFSRIGSVNGGL